MVYEIHIVSTDKSDKINYKLCLSESRLPNLIIGEEKSVLQPSQRKSTKNVNPLKESSKFKPYLSIQPSYEEFLDLKQAEYNFSDFPSDIPKIVLVAGNVGRNFVKKLIKIENAYDEIRYSIFSVLKPSASRDEVIRTAIHVSKSLTEKDTIILWPNDVSLEQENLNLESYLPHFGTKKVLFFSEPYAKNSTKNDDIYAYNRTLEKEIYCIETKYPNLKLFDCNYFLRRNNYLGFKHELRGYAKYILAKYVLFCIRFGFGYHISPPIEDECHLPPDRISASNSKSFVSPNLETERSLPETKVSRKPDMIVVKQTPDGKYIVEECGIKTTDQSRESLGSDPTIQPDMAPPQKKNRKRKCRSRRRRNRRKALENVDVPEFQPRLRS